MYVRYLFFVQQPGLPYESIGCNNENDVEKLLAERPGWKVWESTKEREWRRRPDLEMRGANTR